MVLRRDTARESRQHRTCPWSGSRQQGIRLSDRHRRSVLHAVTIIAHGCAVVVSALTQPHNSFGFCVQQLPDNLRNKLGVGEAPEFEMLRKGGVFLQSDEVLLGTRAAGFAACLRQSRWRDSTRIRLDEGLEQYW